MTGTLAIVETHPVQYHAPVYRRLAARGADVVAVYGGDFSVSGYRDQEFQASFAWDTNLLDGVQNRFVSHVKTGGAKSYEELGAAGLRAELDKLNPAAVMALGYSHPFDRAAIRWALSRRKPLLFRGETSDSAKGRGLLKTLLRDWMLRRLYKRCAALLYVGGNSRRHYARLGVPAARLFFSPYCVNADTFRPGAGDRAAIRRQLGISEDAVVILYSGKLSERKGVDLLPWAVRMLPAPMKDRAHLLFLGDGALREPLRTACAEQPTVPATFAGFQNQSALSSFYLAADLLVLPSRSMETWGLVVNEALLHGLPCVVSDSVGCHPDLVIPGETGAVFHGCDVTSLAKSLKAVISMAGKPGVAARCREQVAGYSVPAAAEGIRQGMQAAGIEP